MSSRNEKTQGNKQSVLESLYELWIDRDPVYDESVRELYRQIGERTAQTSLTENDQLSNIVADLCIAYSRGAFLDGARMAGTLMLEILTEKQFSIDLKT